MRRKLLPTTAGPRTFVVMARAVMALSPRRFMVVRGPSTRRWNGIAIASHHRESAEARPWGLGRAADVQ